MGVQYSTHDAGQQLPGSHVAQGQTAHTLLCIRVSDASPQPEAPLSALSTRWVGWVKL